MPSHNDGTGTCGASRNTTHWLPHVHLVKTVHLVHRSHSLKRIAELVQLLRHKTLRNTVLLIRWLQFVPVWEVHVHVSVCVCEWVSVCLSPPSISTEHWMVRSLLLCRERRCRYYTITPASRSQCSTEGQGVVSLLHLSPFLLLSLCTLHLSSSLLYTEWPDTTGGCYSQTEWG